jgi:hypothetical protein
MKLTKKEVIDKTLTIASTAIGLIFAAMFFGLTGWIAGHVFTKLMNK